MTARPPIRPPLRMLLLAVVLVAASCGSVRPTPSPAGPPDAVVPSAAPGTAGPPAAAPVADLLMLAGGELLLFDAEGIVRPIAGPRGAQVESASAARGSIVTRTAGPEFHVATVSGEAVDRLEWRPIVIDPGTARRPLTELALSPDAGRLAILAADFGSGEPFEVVLVDIATAATHVVPIDREPNGPPVWLDPATVLLEVIPDAAGGPFVRLDLASGAAEAVTAEGYGPAIAADGSVVAVLGSERGVHLLPVDAWLAGAALETGETIGEPVNALRVAVDPTGRRVAFAAADAEGMPVSLVVHARDETGWHLAEQIGGEAARWFGWLR